MFIGRQPSLALLAVTGGARRKKQAAARRAKEEFGSRDEGTEAVISGEADGSQPAEQE